MRIFHGAIPKLTAAFDQLCLLDKLDQTKYIKRTVDTLRELWHGVIADDLSPDDFRVRTCKFEILVDEAEWEVPC